MSNKPDDPQDLFRPLAIEGLTAPVAADLFIDVPASDPGYQEAQAEGCEDDALGALHAEFQRAVADPSRIGSQIRWPAQPALPAGHGQEPGPDRGSSIERPSAHTQLLDLVHPRESIDRFIVRFFAGLDPAERPTLLLETRADEVLQLFSPPRSAARRAALPVTTRRDHHELSPDSALSLPARGTAS